MTVQSNRTLGIVAAILTLFGIVSQATAIFQYTQPHSSGIASVWLVGLSGLISFVAVVGFILFLVAMHGFSKDYNERGIFKNLLYGIATVAILGLIAVMIAAVVFVANIGVYQASTFSLFLTLLPLFAFISLIWVAFNVRAFNLLADTSKVPLFRTSALILLAGAAVTVAILIVVAIIGPTFSVGSSALTASFIPGGLVQDAGWVLIAIAYSRIQPPPSPPPVYLSSDAPSSPPVTPPVWKAKYCTNCGAPIETNAAYCTRCGNKL